MTAEAIMTQLLQDVQRLQPRSATGVMEARARAPADFDRIASTLLGWSHAALGEDALPRTLAAFARFSNDVNLAQGRYEQAGVYPNKTYEECRRAVYDDLASMTDYLWGVYLTNFLWAHHLDLMLFFEQRFLPLLQPGDDIVELAPGHGAWGLWALQHTQDTRLTGHDISAASVQIAAALADASGLAARSAYHQRDALDLLDQPSAQAAACICCFLVEHLEDPPRLLQAMAHCLAPGGVAFFTGALTAAQVDHIHEFRRESELMLLAEQAGFRVLDVRSVAPRRLLQRARLLPRSMGLVLQKRRQADW